MTDTRPQLYGASYSVYVRTARLALTEKQVDYDTVEIDIFASDTVPSDYSALHPFGKIPALRHGELQLFETLAITRYVDEAFDGPALQHTDAERNARMMQAIGVGASYAYPCLVWDIYVERVSNPKDGKTSDEERVEAALPLAATCLSVYADLLGDNRFFGGDNPSLADCHTLPILDYFSQTPEADSMLSAHPALSGWLDGMRARSSWSQATNN